MLVGFFQLTGACLAAQSEHVIATANITEPDQIIEVGVLATRGKLGTAALAANNGLVVRCIAGKQFVLKPFNLEEMAEAVKGVTVDFVITNPGQAVRLGASVRASLDGDHDQS